MKAWALVVVGLLCALGLTAYASANAEAPDFTPPPLYLRDSGSETEAMLGSYSWTLPGVSGRAHHLKHRGPRLSQCWKKSPLLQATTVSLIFQGEPDRVVVQRWDAGAASKLIPPEGSEISVRVAIVDDTVEQLLDLEAGDYCYAVTLYWEEAPIPSGSISYHFHTTSP